MGLIDIFGFFVGIVGILVSIFIAWWVWRVNKKIENKREWIKKLKIEITGGNFIKNIKI